MDRSCWLAVRVRFVPVLDVARGVAAGYRVQPHHDDVSRHLHDDAPLTAALITRALAQFDNLPRNTFLSMPIGASVAATPAVQAALDILRSLDGVVLDVTGVRSGDPAGLDDALAGFRARGARISVGGHGAAQPELASIVRLKPAMLRLGRDWVRDIDHSEAKRAAIETIGELAGQLDARVLAEGVRTSAELRTLAALAVPLAQGPVIGEPRSFLPEVERNVTPVAGAVTRAMILAGNE